MGRGVQWLSNFNMGLAVLLLLVHPDRGPNRVHLRHLIGATGDYLGGFLGRSFRTGAFGGSEWLGNWTIFYWVWWISWVPFVGTFLARISKGRTMREFVIGVLLIPSGVTFVWFAILGGTALNLQLSGAANLTDAVAQPEVALFTLLGEFPNRGGDVGRGDCACRGVLRQRRRRRLDRDGDAVVAAHSTRRGWWSPLGHADGRGGDRAAAVRRPGVAAAGRDHRRGAFTLVLLGLAVSLHRALRAERPPVPELQPSVAIPEPGRRCRAGRAGGS